MKRHWITALVCMLALSGTTGGQEPDNAAPRPGFGDASPPRSFGGRGGAGAGAQPSSFPTQFGGEAGAVPAAGDQESLRRYLRNLAGKTASFASLSERLSRFAEEFAKEVPPRELNVEVAPLEKMPLRRADPKLFENKYVARVAFWPAGLDPTDDESQKQFLFKLHELRGGRLSGSSRLFNVATVQNSPIIAIEYSFRDGPLRLGSSAHFRQLLELAADNVRLKPEVVEFLKSADVERDVKMHASGQILIGEFSHRGFQWTVEVLAPTAEAAEERARAIVQLVDAGFSRATQQEVLAEGKQELAKMQAALAELTKINDAIEAEEKALAAPSEISAEILAQLKSQKVMIAIEEAGLAARVRACDAMLAGGRPLEVSTLQSVSDMKVKAEIERIGLKEKLDQIHKLIREGDDRTARRATIRKLESTTRQPEREFDSAQSLAHSFASLFELHAPFQIPGNKITVAPIEWTAPSQP